MNRHQQEAKKYLSQAFGLNQRIESKLGQIEDLHDLATKATVTYSDMPKSPNRDGSRMEDAIIKCIINKSLLGDFYIENKKYYHKINEAYDRIIADEKRLRLK